MWNVNWSTWHERGIKKKIWVPDRNRAHDLPNTWKMFGRSWVCLFVGNTTYSKAIRFTSPCNINNFDGIENLISYNGPLLKPNLGKILFCLWWTPTRYKWVVHRIQLMAHMLCAGLGNLLGVFFCISVIQYDIDRWYNQLPRNGKQLMWS